MQSADLHINPVASKNAMQFQQYLSEEGILNPSNAKATFVQSTSKPCDVEFIEKLSEYSHMSTHVLGFQPFFRIVASFCIGQINHQQHKGYSCSVHLQFQQYLSEEGIFKESASSVLQRYP